MQPLSTILRQHAVSRHGYADDIQLYNHFKLMDNGSLWEAIQSLEACASEVKTWMAVNKLMLNDAKSKLLVVVPKRHTSAILALRPTITLGSATIEPAEAVHDLGAIFDQHMSMIPQVNTICKSMYLPSPPNRKNTKTPDEGIMCNYSPVLSSVSTGL